MRSRSLAAFAGLLLLAAPLSAQQVSVTPFVGQLVPLTPMIEDTAGGTYYTHTSHTIYGIRISKQMSPGLALQFQGGMGKGGFEAVSGSTILHLESNVYFADLRARLRLLGDDATNLGVIGGAGWTQYGNALFTTAHDQNDGNKMAGRLTGVIGFGVKAHLTGTASLTADLTDRIHEQSVEAPFLPSGLIKPLQHDLAVSFGLNFPLSH